MHYKEFSLEISLNDFWNIKHMSYATYIGAVCQFQWMQRQITMLTAKYFLVLFTQTI